MADEDRKRSVRKRATLCLVAGILFIAVMMASGDTLSNLVVDWKDTVIVSLLLVVIAVLFFVVFPAIMLLVTVPASLEEVRKNQIVGRRLLWIGLVGFMPAALVSGVSTWVATMISEWFDLGYVLCFGALFAATLFIYVGSVMWITGLNILAELQKSRQLREEVLPSAEALQKITEVKDQRR